MSNITSTDILNHIKAELREAEADLEASREALHYFTDADLTNNGLLKTDCRVFGQCEEYMTKYREVAKLKNELRHLQWFCQEQ